MEEKCTNQGQGPSRLTTPVRHSALHPLDAAGTI